MTRTSALVLAAGKGTRMRSAVPKVLVPLAGRPLVMHLLETLAAAGVQDRVLVVGHGAEEVRAALGDGFRYVLQKEQKGMAHAVAMARPLLDVPDGPERVVVTVGDSPLLRAATVRRLVARHEEAGAACTFLTTVFEETPPYARVMRDASGAVTGCVEAHVSVHAPTVPINPGAPSQASGKPAPAKAGGRRGPDAALATRRRRELWIEPRSGLPYESPRSGERTSVREHRTAAATPKEACLGARPRQDRERLQAHGATPDQLAVREVLTSHFVFEARALWDYLDSIRPHPLTGELYLTDIVGLLVDAGLTVEALPMNDSAELLGLNTPEELEWAERRLEVGGD